MLGCICECRLDVCGGATETIFPAAELLLNATDYQRALEFVASRKSMNRYHSVMDFFFCELFTKYRSGAFRYYDDKGPPLREILTPEQVKSFGRSLVIALQIAKRCLDEERRQTWASFARDARVAAEAA